MHFSAAKTKLIWSMSNFSFEQNSVESLAELLLDGKLNALRATFTPSLVPHLKELRSALTSRLETLSHIATPAAHFPYILSLVGRRAIAKISVAKRDVEIGEMLTIDFSVNSDAIAKPQQNSDSKNIEVIFTSDDMFADLRIGSPLIFSYGQVDAVIKEIKKQSQGYQAVAEVTCAGTLISGMDVHSSDISRTLYPLTEADKKALESRCDDLADYILIHGVTSEEQVKDIKKNFMTSASQASKRHPTVSITSTIKDPNAPVPPRFILKIDSAVNLGLLPTLLPHIDGIFLSRSELGLTVPPNSLPLVQKEVIALCNQSAKIVIVASELMYSMRLNPNPTRAEVSDMVNAVSDGADALVLAEEVTEGPYRKSLAEVCRDTIASAEPFLDANWQRVPFSVQNDDDAIAYGALQVAQNTKAKAIVCLTEGGYTALRLSSLRAPIEIIAVTYNKNVSRQLMLCRAVTTITLESQPAFEEILATTKHLLHTYHGFERGDRIVFVSLTASSVAAKNSNLFTMQEID